MTDVVFQTRGGGLAEGPLVAAARKGHTKLWKKRKKPKKNKSEEKGGDGKGVRHEQSSESDSTRPPGGGT